MQIKVAVSSVEASWWNTRHVFVHISAGKRVALLCGKLPAQSKQLVAQLAVSVSNKRGII